MPNATSALPATDLGSAWMTMIGGLFLILALLFVVIWLLKRYGPKAGLGVFHRGDLKMEGQLGIGPKKSVVVVRFLNKVLVLGVTDSRITLLTEMEAEDVQDQDHFSKSLQKARSQEDGSSRS